MGSGEVQTAEAKTEEYGFTERARISATTSENRRTSELLRENAKDLLGNGESAAPSSCFTKYEWNVSSFAKRINPAARASS